MSELGSYAWSKTRGGALNRRDRFTFLMSAMKSRLRRRFSARRHDLPCRRLDLEGLRFVRSRAVDDAFAIAEQAYEPWLLNHCLRSYLWGGLVGQLEAVPIDREALLVTALFHDLGLTSYAAKDGECFAVRGARAAEAACGHSPLGAAAADSISMHLNIAVPASAAPLEYLMHQGAAIDVVGWDAVKVRPAIDTVLQQHPRLAFKKKFSDLLAAEAQAHPGGRLAMMIRFGFLDFIAHAPYAE